jgi:hypothetical protein
VHRISHFKNSNWYVVINNYVTIFQRYVIFGPPNHEVKEQDQGFCAMLLQNAYNSPVSNNKIISIPIMVYFKGSVAEGSRWNVYMYIFIR